MASWQYTNPAEHQPVVPTDKGYYVSYPEDGTSSARKNVTLDYDGGTLQIWVYDITMSFQIGGTTAQSAYYRSFYPRNMIQPVISVQGQTASQYEYAEISEFIRRTQLWALKPIDTQGKGNTIGFTLPAGGIQNHAHEGHHFRGHIKNIQRSTSRFVNAPEFQFDFIIVTAYSGLFSVTTGDASTTKDRLAMYMQIPNTIRSRNGVQTGTTSFAIDPDSSYDKGNVPG